MIREIKTGSLQMIAAMLISGTIGALVVISQQPIANVVFWRCVFATITLFILGLMSGHWRSHLNRRVVMIAALGGVALVVNWLLLFAAYSRTSIGLATVLYNTQPLMLVGMGVFILKEKVSRSKWLWLGASFVGMLLVLSSGLSHGGNEGWFLGIMLALGAAFFYALTALITRQLRGIPPQQIALVQVAVGTLLLLPLVDFRQHMTFTHWGIVATLGILHTGIMYQLLYGAIQKLPTSITASLSFIYPIVAVVVDRFVFNHSLSPIQFFGGAMILLAAAGINLGWGEKRRTKAVLAKG
ncbi:DMT family transporter [Cedecea neteri]|uniref:DMT family transporter n=1 Tax=Cedecea neteri TaxID=158822 RepID=UPI00289FE099|nr:DMT family transporter [Cedecea neteri]